VRRFFFFLFLRTNGRRSSKRPRARTASAGTTRGLTPLRTGGGRWVGPRPTIEDLIPNQRTRRRGTRSARCGARPGMPRAHWLGVAATTPSAVSKGVPGRKARHLGRQATIDGSARTPLPAPRSEEPEPPAFRTTRRLGGEGVSATRGSSFIGTSARNLQASRRSAKNVGGGGWARQPFSQRSSTNSSSQRKRFAGGPGWRPRRGSTLRVQALPPFVTCSRPVGGLRLLRAPRPTDGKRTYVGGGGLRRFLPGIGTRGRRRRSSSGPRAKRQNRGSAITSEASRAGAARRGGGMHPLAGSRRQRQEKNSDNLSPAGLDDSTGRRAILPGLWVDVVGRAKGGCLPAPGARLEDAKAWWGLVQPIEWKSTPPSEIIARGAAGASARKLASRCASAGTGGRPDRQLPFRTPPLAMIHLGRLQDRCAETNPHPGR